MGPRSGLNGAVLRCTLQAMQVVVQKCQECGSQEVRNILVRKPGRAQLVYVACAGCGELVARYRLRDYYHHGKGIESFLRAAGAVHGDSARGLLGEFEQTKGEAVEEFEEVKRILEGGK